MINRLSDMVVFDENGSEWVASEVLEPIMMAFPEHDLKEFILEKDVDGNADTDEEAEADD